MVSALTDFLYPFHNKDRIKYGFLGEFLDSLVAKDLDKKTLDYLVRPDTATYMAAFPGMLECIFHYSGNDIPVQQRQNSHELAALLFGFMRITDGITERLMKEEKKSEIPEFLEYLGQLQTGGTSLDRIALREYEARSVELFAKGIQKHVKENPDFPRYLNSVISAVSREGRAKSIDDYIAERRDIGSACGDLLYFCISGIDQQDFKKDKDNLQNAFRQFGAAGNLADAYIDWKRDLKANVIEFQPRVFDRLKLAFLFVSVAYQGFRRMGPSFIPLGLGMSAAYIATEIVDYMREQFGYKKLLFNPKKIEGKLERFRPQLEREGALHSF